MLTFGEQFISIKIGLTITLLLALAIFSGLNYFHQRFKYIVATFDKILHQIVNYIGDQTEYWEKVKQISHTSIHHLHHHLIEVHDLIPQILTADEKSMHGSQVDLPHLPDKITTLIQDGQQYLQMDDFIAQISQFYMTKNKNIEDLTLLYDFKGMRHTNIDKSMWLKKLIAFSHDLEYLVDNDRYPPVIDPSYANQNVEFF